MSLFNRLKTWIFEEVVKNRDLNGEFDNIINHLTGFFIGGVTTLGQFQNQIDPGGLGTENLGSSVQDEIDELKFVIARITGQTYWYESPVKSLAAGTSDFVFYQPFDGADTTDVFQDFMRRGGYCNPLTLTSADVSSAKFSTSQSKFTNASYTMGSSSVMAVSGRGFKKNQGSLSAHFYNIGVSDYIAYNPQLGIELFTDASGHLNSKMTLQTAASETAKNTKTITGTNVVTGATSWKHAFLSWRTSALGGATTDAMSMNLDGTAEGTQISLTSAPVQTGDGGFWFLGAKRNDPTWTKQSAMNGLPTADSTNAWSASGVAGSGAVSNGILTITTDNTNKGLKYVNTFGIDMSQMTVEFKMRITDTFDYFNNVLIPSPVDVLIRDDSMDRSFRLSFTRQSVQMSIAGTVTGSRYIVPVEATNWHVYRITMSGATNPVVNLYVDGLFVGTVTCSTSDATATDTIEFGDPDNTNAGHKAVSQWEYIRYTGAAVTAPIVTGGQGSLSDVALLTEFINDSAITTALSTTKAGSVIGKDKLPGPATYTNVVYHTFDGSSLTTNVSTWAAAAGGVAYFNSDGVTPIDVMYYGWARDASTSGYNVKIIFDDEEAQVLPNTSSNGVAGADIGTVLANNSQQFVLRHCRTFRPGLHNVKLYIISLVGGEVITFDAPYLNRFVINQQRGHV